MRETRELNLKAIDLDIDRHARRELFLLVVAAIFIAVNFGALQMVRGGFEITHWLPYIIWLGSAFICRIILQRMMPERDALILPLVMFLCGWGLVIIDRLQPAFADRQAMWLIISSAAMLATALLPHPLRWIQEYRYLILLLGLVLLLATIMFGTNPSDAIGAPRLWLNVAGVYFQPSEILKIALVAFLASYLAENYAMMRAGRIERHQLFLSPRISGPIGLMWGLTLVMLIWQRDLGTAALFFITFIAVLYVATGYRFIVVAGVLLLFVAGILAYSLFDLVQLRIDIWVNPWTESSGRAYQIVQSLLAFASGGVFGQGIGQGSPYYIPVAHSDFLFAALGEEFGLVGVFTLIICIAVLILRGMRIALAHYDHPFHSLFTIGLTTVLAVQSLLIMGGVLKVIPLTGVTLPFMSYGGSSLLASFIMVGFLLRLSALEKSN